MTLTESIQQMIISAIESTEITSANPVHINRVIQVNSIPSPNLDSLISGRGGGRSISPREQKEQEFLSQFSDLTQRETSNLRSFAVNPQNFMAGQIFGRVGTLATGAALFTAVLALVQQILDQMMRPGGPLDRRFKLIVDQRIQIFQANQERADLSLGYKTVRSTSYPSPRGGIGIVGSNLSKIQNGDYMKIYQSTEEQGLFTRLS